VDEKRKQTSPTLLVNNEKKRAVLMCNLHSFGLQRGVNLTVLFIYGVMEKKKWDSRTTMQHMEQQDPKTS